MRTVGLRYGLILGLISIVIGLGSNLLGLTDPANQKPGTGILIGVTSFVITFIVIHLAIKHYRDAVNQGVLSLGSAIKLGILVAIIAGLIAGAFNLFYFTFVEPDFYDRVLATVESNMEDQGMSQKQIDQAIRITRIFTNPITGFLTGIIWSSFIGLIVSLISGLILKKDPEQMAA